MIELSPAAQIAENAARAMTAINDEMGELQATSEQYRAEMRDLLAEHATAAQRQHNLAAAVATTREDLRKCELAEEVCTGTAREQEAKTATQAATALWDAARESAQEYDTGWIARNHAIEERLSFLKTSLEETAAMSQSLQIRHDGLRDIYDSARADQGKHEQARLEEEFAIIAENRKTVLQMLTEVDQQESALREQIIDRLRDWPLLAMETLGAHLDYQPGAMQQILTNWLHAARIAGDQALELDSDAWHAYIGNTTIPLWHLHQYGPREKYIHLPERKIEQPLKIYEAMMVNLAATLESTEQAERDQQVKKRLRAAGI